MAQKEGERNSAKNLFFLMVEHFSLPLKNRKEFQQKFTETTCGKVKSTTFGRVLHQCKMERWITDPASLFPPIAQKFDTYDDYKAFFAEKKAKATEKVEPAPAGPTTNVGTTVKLADFVVQKKQKRRKPKGVVSKATGKKATEPKAEESGPTFDVVREESQLTGWSTMAMKPVVKKPVAEPVAKPKAKKRVKKKQGNKKQGNKKQGNKKPRQFVTKCGVPAATKKQFLKEQEEAKAAAAAAAKAESDSTPKRIPGLSDIGQPTQRERVAEAQAKFDAARKQRMARQVKPTESNDWKEAGNPSKVIASLEKIAETTYAIAKSGMSDKRVEHLKKRVERLTENVDTSSLVDVLRRIQENFDKISENEETLRNAGIHTEARNAEIRVHQARYPAFVESMKLISIAGKGFEKHLMTEMMKPFPTRKEMLEQFDPSPFKEEDIKYAQDKYCAAELGPRSLRREVLNWWNRCREGWDDSKAIHGTGKYGFSYQTVRGDLSREERSEMKEQNKVRKKRVKLWREECSAMRSRKYNKKRRGGATKSS